MIRRFTTMSSRVLQESMLAAALACTVAPLAHAQQVAPDDDTGEPASSTAHPVVQPLGPSPTRALNDALSRLARDPRDMAALVDAGSAALDLGDTDAAIGFFSRAEQVAPGNGQVRARIGSAMLRSNQPFEAIRWFDLADQAGADRAAMATDRGLAYDLIGDNAAAQRQYQLALSGRQNDEASRRYAVSLVIAGDRRGAELVVQPLLERRDRGAWRVRTFIMAISGQSDEAEGIARATMPADLAAAISPYLRYMPRLTPAQQAAAANLGRFPRAADIGRDDPQIVQYAALHPRAPRVDAGLVPAGAALGGKGRDDRDSRARRRRPGRDTEVAAARPPAQPTPPAVSAPWGLPPGGTTQVRTQVAAAPAQAAVATPQPFSASQSPPQNPPLPAAPRTVPAPVVLSRLDVPPGTPLSPPPLPAPKPAPALPLVAARPSPTVPAPTVPAPTVPVPALPAPALPAPAPVSATISAPTVPITMPVTTPVTPAPAPASAPQLAPPSVRQPVSAQGVTLPSAPKVPAPAVAAPVAALASSPQPSPAAVPLPVPASGPAPSPAPAPLPAPQVSPPPAQPAPVVADFRSAFAGFQPPEQEAAPTAAAVDLARIEALRGAAAKAGRAKGKDRGERPDGPTAVSRISDEDAVAVSSKSARDKAAKDKPETTKAAKEKAALDKACLDLANAAKAAKGSKGKPAKGKTAKGNTVKGSSGAKAGTKAGKDPVCPADSEQDKKGKATKAQPSHASRIWVQVLTGANRDMMGREWQRLVREASALRGRKPSITPWRSNFRLLTGPFDSDADAQAFLEKLRKEGVSAFEWTSPAGQAVDSLQLN